MTEPMIGIDFGTTTSSMAWVDPATGKAEILMNAEGELKTPSVVYFGDGTPKVGTPAEQMLEDEDERRRVVASVKRELANAPTLALPDRRVTPQQVAAAIFAKLKRDAEELHFRQLVTRAVVTCPAAFDYQERDGIRQAALEGGFVEVELLDEPVAAALAYSRAGLEVGRHLLIYDLGGGTFDLALLRATDDGFELALEPKGLRRCGGDDFDLALYDYCDAEARHQWGEPLDGTGRDLRFLRECRKRKESLSALDKVLFSSLVGAGRIFKHTLTRAAFEDLIRPRVEMTVRLTGELVGAAESAGAAVETAVLIGGSSRVPLIQSQLAEALPVAPRRWQHQDVAVALGAAYGAQSEWEREPGPIPGPTPGPNPKAAAKLPKQVFSDQTVLVGIVDVAALDLALIESLVESVVHVADPEDIADFRDKFDEIRSFVSDIRSAFLDAGGTHIVLALTWSGDDPEADPEPHFLLRFESGIADPGAIEYMTRLSELLESEELLKSEDMPAAVPLDRHWFAISEGCLSGDGSGPVAKTLNELEPMPINLSGYVPDVLKEKAVAEISDAAPSDRFVQMLLPLQAPFRALSSASITMLGAEDEVTLRLSLTLTDAQAARAGAELLADFQVKVRAMLALQSAHPQAENASALKGIADVCADVRIGFEADRILVDVPWRIVTAIVRAFNPEAEELTESAQRVHGDAHGPSRLGRVPSVQDLHGQPTDVVQWLQRETAEALGLPVGFRHRLKDGGEGPDMLVVPPGRFLMGSASNEDGRQTEEHPQHPVTIAQPFAIGRFTVSFAEYDAFCVATGRQKPGDESWGRRTRPVVNVSWKDADAYCEWLGRQTGHAYRLPSEAEWEYAARAGTTSAFWWGDRVDTDRANYDGNYNYAGGPKGEYRGRTLPVAAFEPNPFGLYQVHGNVWEWCQDDWHGDYEGAPTDGSAWEETNRWRRVRRGGSWYKSPLRCRAAYRDWEGSGVSSSKWGFRVCCDGPIKPPGNGTP